MITDSIYKTARSRDELLDFYDSVVSKWSFPFEQVPVPTRFGETNVITAGKWDNPALVLIHGSASNILSWGGAIPAYLKDFYVIVPDIPGEVGRSAPIRPSWGNDD
jgi:pimeloyl-ACP methyl ester carboxylesterase